MKLELKRGALLWFSGRFLSSNVYLIVVDNGVVAIDCGMSWTANRVLDYLNKNRLRLEYIFLTHSHFDHVMGMKRFKEHTETRVVAHTRSKRGDVKVMDGDIINALDDQLSFLVTYTGVQSRPRMVLREEQPSSFHWRPRSHSNRDKSSRRKTRSGTRDYITGPRKTSPSSKPCPLTSSMHGHKLN